MDNATIPASSGDIIITYNIPGNNEPYELPFYVLDAFQKEQSQNSLVMGVTIGSCSVLLIFLVGILYKTNKFSRTGDTKKFYKNFLFYLNCLILLMGIIRAACFTNYLLGPLNSSSFSFTGWYSDESFASSDAANGFRVILFALIELSMVFQVYVMFKTPTLKLWGYAVTILSATLGLVVVGFTINITVLSHRRFVNTVHQIDDTGISSIWLDLPTILFSISINIMSLLLIGKLIVAIKTRRFLGLKQFDSFHILLICSTQTLIIPSIILFVHYFKGLQNSDVLLVNISTMLIVLTLPFSSLWAQTANNTQYIQTSPSLSFISRESSGRSTLHSAGGVQSEKNYRITKLNTDGSSPITLKDDANSLILELVKPVSGIDAHLPPDIERILRGDDDDEPNVDDGFVSTEVTFKKV
ncbi:Pheromone alpha factor receptor [Candida viswanathii]|uniref:Pheromone alpha factor receptor n=1 Tax=Candida viswanathii TaxID=5486 RepID=A0A367XZL6_9ASCO|nr:Pheromone alpha factor receptor [Candida viswanathii]